MKRKPISLTKIDRFVFFEFKAQRNLSSLVDWLENNTGAVPEYADMASRLASLKIELEELKQRAIRLGRAD